MFDNPHIILDEYKSLERHHFAKQNIREKQIDTIELKQNDQILDIGIGPGFYLNYWLKMSKEKNCQFTLFDLSKEFLEICLKNASSIDEDHRLKIVSGDLYQINSIINDKFDVIFIGNTIEYIKNPSNYIKTKILPLLKKGGKIVLRDLDCGYVNCNLIDPALCHKIVLARIKGCQDISLNDNTFHDPFIGRNLKYILEETGFKNCTNIPFVCSFEWPLNNFQKDYLTKLHKNWYLEDRCHLLSKEEKEFWSNSFDLNNKNCLLNRKGFYYTEVEFLAIGTKA